MSPRSLIFLVGVGLAVSGCGQKKGADLANKDLTAVPKVTQKKDTAKDAFDEFYSEGGDKAPAKADKPGAQKTFSTSTPSTASSTTSPAAPRSSAPAPIVSAKASSTYTADFAADGRYTVQISTVASSGLANRLTEQLKNKGYPAYVAEVQNPTPALNGTYYRIRIAGFSGVSPAREFAEKTLVPSGYSYWIDKKANDNVGMEGRGLGEGAASSGYSAAPASKRQPSGAAASMPAEPSTPTWQSSPTPAVTTPAEPPAASAPPPSEPTPTPSAAPAASPSLINAAAAPLPSAVAPAAVSAAAATAPALAPAVNAAAAAVAAPAPAAVAPIASPAPVAQPAAAPAPSPAPAAEPAPAPKASAPAKHDTTSDGWGDDGWGTK